MGKNKKKVCRFCGKIETKHWKRHWKTNHNDDFPRELEDGKLPITPYSGDWFEKLPKEIQKRYSKTKMILEGKKGIELTKEDQTGK